MRYDAETHSARAAMLAERASLADCPRQRLMFISHAIVATVLARLARQHRSGTLFVYLDLASVDDVSADGGHGWQH
jgi:ABC-type oligopeptide transport system ATPase subunit